MVLKSLSKDEETLAEIVDQGIRQGADGHFTVGSHLCATAEGKKVVDAFMLQCPARHRPSHYIIGEPIANHNLRGETDDQLQGGAMPREDDKLTAQIPDQAAEAIIDNGGNMLAHAANIEQEKHQRRAKYEVQNADDQVEHKRAIYHLLDLFHCITKTDRITRIIPQIAEKASLISPMVMVIPATVCSVISPHSTLFLSKMQKFGKSALHSNFFRAIIMTFYKKE